MGRKKQKKAKPPFTKMRFDVTEDDEVTVVPMEELPNIKLEEELEDDPDPLPSRKVSIDDRQCHMCHKVMKNKHVLKAHMIVHKFKTFKCVECEMTFASQNALNRHKQCKHMDMNLRPHPCHMCEQRFLNKSHLATHIKTHTGERDVTCGLCFQSFYSKADLVRHMKGRHLNIRSFTCHLCNRGFFRKSYLKVHLLSIHMTPEADATDGLARCYACRYCKKIFTSRTTCYSHEKSHTGQQEHRALCMICGKTFSRPSSLKKHLEKHSGPPKIRCEHCDRLFYHGSSYKRHLLIHNRPDPDICQVCGKVYTNRDAFRRHLRKHVKRGDLDQLPPSQREMPRISKMQALISKGVDLDEILKSCKVEVVELGGKNNSSLTRARNKAVDHIIDEAQKNNKWILEVNELNKAVTCYVRDEVAVSDATWQQLDAVAPQQRFSVQCLGVVHDTVYTVISRDFQSIVKSGSLRGSGGLDFASFAKPALIFTLKSFLSGEDERSRQDSGMAAADIVLQKDVNVELFSTVTEIDIPRYVEEIPDIKPEFLDNFGQDMFQYVDGNEDIYVDDIDLSVDVYRVSVCLDANLTETLKPLQLAWRAPQDLEKGFDAFEANVHAPLRTVRSTEKERDWSMFRKSTIVEWTDEELQVKIANILNGKTRVFSIHNMVNISEDSEKLNEIVAATDGLNNEETLHEEEDGLDMDDFIYEESMDHQSDSEVDLKPDVNLLEPKVEPEEPEPPEVYDENKENRKKRKRRTRAWEMSESEEEYVERKPRRKREMSESEEEYVEKKPRRKREMSESEEEYVEKKRKRKRKASESDEEYVARKPKKRGRKKKKKKKLKEKKTKKKTKVKVEVKEEMDETEVPWNPPVKTICTEFICYHCLKRCATKGTLMTHIRSMHLLEKACSCHECGKSFIAKSRLEAHIENVHLKVRNFQCASCEWSFYSHADLERHERRHTGVKPFMCHLCSKTFVRKAQLKSHIVIHSGERNFVCNMCGKNFATRSTLSTHLKRHAMGRTIRFYKPQGAETIRRTPGVPILCNHCGKELSTPHSLKRHIELVHEKKNTKPRIQKPFQCPYCELSFGYRTSMQRHMHKAHEKFKEPRSHACPVCGRRLLDEICVLRHMVKRHPYNCDNIEAMNAAVAKAMQRHIPCPICKRKFLKEKGMHKHMAKKHFYKTEEVYSQHAPPPTYQPPPLPPPPQVHYALPEEKPNLLLL